MHGQQNIKIHATAGLYVPQDYGPSSYGVTCRWLATFRKNPLPPSSRHKSPMFKLFEKSITIYKTNCRNHNSNFTTVKTSNIIQTVGFPHPHPPTQISSSYCTVKEILTGAFVHARLDYESILIFPILFAKFNASFPILTFIIY